MLRLPLRLCGLTLCANLRETNKVGLGLVGLALGMELDDANVRRKLVD